MDDANNNENSRSDINLFKIEASRRLNRQIIEVNNNCMSLIIYWSRICYASNESLLTKNQKHTFYELQHVIRGSVDFIVDNTETLTLEAGYFLIVPPDRYHRIVSYSPDTEKMVIGFHMEPKKQYLNEVLDKLDTISIYDTFNKSKENDIIMLINLLERNAFYTPPCSGDLITDYMQCLLIEYFRHIIPSYTETDDERSKYSENEKRIQQIRNYINKNKLSGIKVKDLARVAGVGVRQLNRICISTAGKAPKDLIDSELIISVKELLTTTNLSYSDIAELCGFSSEYALNRFFHRIEGMTIGSYKKYIRM